MAGHARDGPSFDSFTDQSSICSSVYSPVCHCPCACPSAPLQLIGRANFSFFRFGKDPVLREGTIKPAEEYERGPKDVFMIHPGQVLYLQGFFDIPGRCQSRAQRDRTHAHAHPNSQ